MLKVSSPIHGLSQWVPKTIAAPWLTVIRIRHFGPGFEERMFSDQNDNDRRLLDEAAKVFRQRVRPGSRFSPLLDGEAGLKSNSLEAGAPQSDRSDLNLLCTRLLSRSLEPTSPQIGDMPAEPPTLRGRVGALLVRIVQRALFWYTGQIRTFQTRVADAAREQMLAFQNIEVQQRNHRAQLTQMHQHIVNLEGQIQTTRQEQGRRLAPLEGSVADGQRHLKLQAARLERIQENVDAALQSLARLDQELAQQIKTSVQHLEQQLLQQDLHLKMLIAERQGRFQQEATTQTSERVGAVMRHIYDPLFVDHARSFRGGRADIKNRLSVYLPYAHEAFTVTAGAPALDLGCGRGEWLEMLRAAGITATGIDLNRELVKGCRELGLEASEAELPGSLSLFPDESYSIISAIHLLEHMSFEDILEVIDQSIRILKPGGIVIFETPDPKNLFVASNNFYLDPTHRQPLPSEFLSFVVEARGFCDPTVIPLSPYPDYLHLPASDCPAVQFINHHFYGPQDNAIVARKA
jgi:O-antigen chain-terminating methyltransferase